MTMAFSRPAENSSATFVNTAFLEEQLLKCTVCLEKFDQNMHVPKQLSCNHTFCKQCIISVHNTVPPPRNVLKCPTCRREHWIGDSGIDYLPTDHRVIQMMDVLSTAATQTQDVCQQHPGEILKFFCKNCQVPICRDCTVTLHKESKGHDITDVAQALDELTPKFTETHDKTKRALDRLNQKMESNASYTRRLDENKSEVTEKIEQAFAEYHLVLDQRKAQLLAQVDGKIKCHKSKATRRNNAISPSVATITSLHEKFEEATKRKKVGQLVTLSRQMDEWADSVNEIDKSTDNPTFTFTRQGEEHFQEHTRALGIVERYGFDPFAYIQEAYRKRMANVRTPFFSKDSLDLK